MKGLGYCELQVDLSSGVKIYKAIGEFADQCPGLVAINKLHATIMYDVSNPLAQPPKSDKLYKAKIKGVTTLGEPGNKWYAAVLLLDCPGVIERHEQLVKSGYKHSYPDLLLHVSLCYGESTAIFAPELEQLFKDGKLPETITLCNETWEELED